MAQGRSGMAKEFSVEADISEPVRMLSELGGRKSTVMRHLLSGIGTAAKAQVKKAYRKQGLSKRTGALYKSIERKVFRNGKAVIIQAKAQRDGKAFYGYALAKGSRIEAKGGGYLTFQAEGKWVKVHSVKLPERDFVSAPAREYLQSAGFNAKLDQLVAREVAKIEKRKAKEGSS